MKTITISDEKYESLKDQLKEAIEEKTIGIEIKNLAGSVLFTSSKTTIKEAVEEAVSEGANLVGADFRYTNLRDTNFEGADLWYTNLRDTNLRGADFRYTNLRDTNFEGANLRDANFVGANFFGKGGNTKIKNDQLNDFLSALGIIVGE